MKKILILTDFSKNSLNAMAYTMAFYAHTPIFYVLAHITPPNGMSSLMETMHGYFTGEAVTHNLVMDELDVIRKRVLAQSSLKKNQIKIACLEASFTQGIKTIANKYNVDLIVMGTKGKSNATNKTIGTYTTAVITKVKYPILIVPEAATFKKSPNIVFPTDYDFVYKAKVLNTLLELVKEHKSNLSILRVANSNLSLSPFQEKNRAYLKDYLNDVSVSFHRINQPELEQGIQFFIDTMQINMVAMVAKNLNFFQKLLFNPTSRAVKVSYLLSVPFLVLHE